MVDYNYISCLDIMVVKANNIKEEDNKEVINISFNIEDLKVVNNINFNIPSVNLNHMYFNKIIDWYSSHLSYLNINSYYLNFNLDFDYFDKGISLINLYLEIFVEINYLDTLLIYFFIIKLYLIIKFT